MLLAVSRLCWYDKEPGMPHLTLYFHMIPVVGLEQMVLIGILLEYGRTALCIFHTSLITIIAAKTCCRIVIAAITKIVSRKCVTAQEDTTAPFCSCPDVSGTGIIGQEKSGEST